MNNLWREELYSPSSACEVAPYELLESEQLEAEIRDFQQASQGILENPYDPELWLNRAHCLRLLGYPELALGDIYKARLLAEAALSSNSTTIGTLALEAYSKNVYNLHMTHPAYVRFKSCVSTPELLKTWSIRMLGRVEVQIWTELMEGLLAANCCDDYLRLSKEAVQKFPEDDIFPSEVANAENWNEQRIAILQERVDDGEMTEEQMSTNLLSGGVYPVAYPWMTDDILTRDEDLLQKLKSEFLAVSTNCTVAKSTIRDVADSDDGEALSEVDVLGVISTSAIDAGSTVLIDATTASAISSTSRCPTCCGAVAADTSFVNECCEVRYCSETCSSTALEKFHKSICKKDLSFLTSAAEKATKTTDFSIDSLLLLRVLALSMQEAASTHPLQSSLLSRLTPTYDMAEPQLIIFNFATHIATPLQTLQALGVDVFARAEYDTWVLHTMRCRLQNNKHGQTLDGAIGTAVNPLYSMFNHSCEPNVDWRHDARSSTVTMFAERDVAPGHELLISYIRGRELLAPAGVLPRPQRAAMLMTWFGMDCRCARCEREKLAEAVEGLEI
ncbi:WD and tetratricopeptide repeat protein [Phlyctema vagabunda]|uniref:WD and tetratricopeptide repeat protein n=1 Tax=Phlyctema vagabunda TaxID=108571 RepID=A0ABR4P6A6_9HELO